tara:strand:- start:467 stop:568 length:102 start_codon:yes stop_codon:yes gene_type:complete
LLIVAAIATPSLTVIFAVASDPFPETAIRFTPE